MVAAVAVFGCCVPGRGRCFSSVGVEQYNYIPLGMLAHSLNLKPLSPALLWARKCLQAEADAGNPDRWGQVQGSREQDVLV